jgi:hypothetical protein
MRDRWRTLSWLVRLTGRRRRGPARAGLRPGGPAGRATVVMMAMSLPLSLSLGAGAGGGAAALRWPSPGSLVSSVARLADVVTDQHPAAPKTPVQRTGSAPSRSRQVPAAVTRAVKDAEGLRPAKGRGQLPAFSLHAPAKRTFVTGSASRGTTASFNPRTSKLVASGTTATSDLYKNADGSYTKRVYGTAVNYRTSAGAWAAVDTDLAPAGGGRWDEKANSASVSFAGRAADKQLGSLAAGGAQSVSFSLAGAANVAGTADGATVTYPGVMPGTDLTETAAANGGISETLVLHSADVATSWDFPLQTAGLTPVLRQGSVDLENAAGQTVWVIPPAVASSGPAGLTDGTPQATSVLTYQLVPYAGGTELEMTLDPSWLDAPGRDFPVVVDPTLLPPDHTEYSTYVEEDGSTPYTADNGTSDFMPVGYYDPYTSIGLLDFSGEIGDVIPNYHVTVASLDLFDVWADQCTTSEDVDLYQATSAWGSSGTPARPPIPARRRAPRSRPGPGPRRRPRATTPAGRRGWAPGSAWGSTAPG